MEKKKSISQLLKEYQLSTNPEETLNHIEDQFGKDVKIEILIANFTQKLQKKGFNVSEYMAPYIHWNSYERMKLLQFKLQEMEDPVILNITNIIKKVNESFTKEQMFQIRQKMNESYFAVLYMNNSKPYFKVNEEYYDALRNLYYERLPNILL